MNTIGHNVCDIPSAVYLINLSHFCIVNFLLKKRTKLVESNYDALVELYYSLILAEGITARLSIIVTMEIYD